MPARADTAPDGRATAERIVDEGLRLFAENGFHGTTVGEIERRAGLTPRAGALYKHFPSKEAVLEAAFERHVAELEELRTVMDLMPLGDLRAELTLIARSALQLLARERSLRRIVITEGNRFPDLKRRFKTGIVDRAYGDATDFVRLKMETGEFPDGDAEAMAVAMVGSLLAYELEIDVFDRPPAGVDEERLIAAVVDSWMAMSHLGGKERRSADADRAK